MTATQLRLMDFYQVDTLDKLIEKQAEHIIKLQCKVELYEKSASTNPFSFRPRQGSY